ncbi:MAG: F0F1 ATP synthase subunit A [Phycisphaerae bacterium]|nr:F0F1 ATP synthase subunit A [Phycisphaerae bacterium]
MLGSVSILDHVVDTPWPGCSITVGGMEITWMSSGIASMLLVAAVLLVFLPILSRRCVAMRSSGAVVLPGGPKRSIGGSIIEVIVLFVRDEIAVPSMGKQQAMVFLPFLLTVFVFILGMNLTGLLPFSAISYWATGGKYPVGHTPTSILTVCGALALLAAIAIIGSGLYKAAQRSKLPTLAALPLSPLLWFLSLAPHIPGTTGKIMAVPLAALELIGVFAKCFSLMVRLFANMIAGHMMLAVMMMFIVQTLVSAYTTAMDATVANEVHFFYIGPVCIIGSVLIEVLELLVAGLQAYIYTFLTAMFLGIYAEPSH